MSTVNYPYGGHMVTVLQAHNGKVYHLSTHVTALAADRGYDEMLSAIAESMDRKLLNDLGHVDKGRYWFASDMTDSGMPAFTAYDDDTVWILDGPHAGHRVPFRGGRTLHVANGGNEATYSIEPAWPVLAGAFLHESFPLATYTIRSN